MKKILSSVIAAALFIQAAGAAETIKMTVQAKRAGIIKGDNADGSITGLAFEQAVVVNTDTTTGQTTSRRQHKPLTIVKTIDRATPALYQALVTNDQLKTVVLKFYRTKPGTSTPEQYYTITLTDAVIISVRNWKPNTRDLSADRAGDLEEVSFTSQKIEWSWSDGTTTSTASDEIITAP